MKKYLLAVHSTEYGNQVYEFSKKEQRKAMIKDLKELQKSEAIHWATSELKK